MKRLLYIAGMLIASALFYAGSASANEPFAGCEAKDCVTLSRCGVECSRCAGSGHDRICEGITEVW